MTGLRAITNKELRAYFLSPIALIFIATFLLASLFAFFWVEGFFARGVADIRPLFEWLPVLLIFLVPALGMRLWSEEERMGTMELLRTFPLKTSTLVLGKFLSGIALVGVALALTLPVPITVELLGDLDWGPVIGGYLAALLLAGAYLSIALCVSAVTASQIVALVFGAVACGALYVVGADAVVSLFGNVAGEILRELGAGSRFESILRGVVDLRDLLYYASLIVVFLALNVVLLEARRWSDAPERRRSRANRRGALGLLALNLAALNVLVAPVRWARIDLTENQEYSISPVTRELLESIDEPLLIRGYFSAKTHPLLAPLVPRIRDMIEEYGAVGGDNVRAEVVDPLEHPELEKEANQAYNIESVPFQFSDRHEASVVNSYFHVVVRYGDQFETLGFDDLIEIQVHGMDIDVRLRNLEYDLTRAIQKTIYGFSSLESVIARLPAPARLVAVVTPNALPEELAGAPGAIRTVGEEIAARSGGRFSWEMIDPGAPGGDPALSSEALEEKYGIRPLARSLFSDDTFYLHLLLEVGEHVEPIVPEKGVDEADIREAVVSALERAGPGSLETVGVFTGGGENPAGLSYGALREHLAQTYRVEDAELRHGKVGNDVDVLLVLDPRELSLEETYAIDQFLMRGGSVVIAGGSHAVDPSSRQKLTALPTQSHINDLIGSYGVRIGNGVVLDVQSDVGAIPVQRDLGGGVTVPAVQMVRYPAFVDVRGEGLASDNPATTGLPQVILHWPSPVELVGGAPNAGDAKAGAAGTDAETAGHARAADETEAAEAPKVARGSEAANPAGDAEAAKVARGSEAANAAGDAETDGGSEAAKVAGAATSGAGGSVLLASSPQAWMLDEYSDPNFDLHELGWPVRGDGEVYGLAVARMGPFDSHYRNRDAPVLGAGDAEDGAAGSERGAPDSEHDGPDLEHGAPDSADSAASGGRRGNVIERSPERSRLVVIGSSSFASDFMVGFTRQFSDIYLTDLQLVQNVIDWCLEDVDLLAIRTRGSYTRRLPELEPGVRETFEWANYAIAILAVIAIGVSSLGRRRNAVPLPLPAAQDAEAPRHDREGAA